MEVKMEETEYKKRIKEYLVGLRDPCSFQQLQLKFPTVNPAEIVGILEELKQTQQINTINMFLNNRGVKFHSVRMEYIEVDKHPLDKVPPVQSSTESTEITSKESHSQQEISPKKGSDNVNGGAEQAVNVKKNIEDMTDEELYEYKQSLLQKRSELDELKHLFNTKSEKIKAIQSFNQIKEIACTVFERIGTIKRQTTRQVCNDFGINLDEN